MPELILIGKQLGLSALATPELTGQSESGGTQVALRNTAWTGYHEFHENL